jgi:catechol 2,3-dioxygenase-like lactoylglutathione lyase family enzyme
MPLRYAGLRVTRLARSVRFYTKVLGLTEIGRGDARSEGLGVWVLLEDPRTKQRIELNWYPSGSRFAGAYRLGDGLDHLGFLLGRVPRARLEQEYRRLLRHGATATEITPATTDGWVAFVRDPDGIWIEIFRWPTAAELRAQRPKRPKPRARRRVAA